MSFNKACLVANIFLLFGIATQADFFPDTQTANTTAVLKQEISVERKNHYKTILILKNEEYCEVNAGFPQGGNGYKININKLPDKISFEPSSTLRLVKNSKFGLTETNNLPSVYDAAKKSFRSTELGKKCEALRNDPASSVDEFRKKCTIAYTVIGFEIPPRNNSAIPGSTIQFKCYMNASVYDPELKEHVKKSLDPYLSISFPKVLKMNTLPSQKPKKGSSSI